MKPLYVIATKCKGGGVQILKPRDNGQFPADHWLYIDKHHSAKPDYRHKYIMLNCYKYHIFWDKRGNA